MKIIIQSLKKSYGDLIALNKIDIELDTGVYGLLGHNGAGKSTLIKILTTTLSFDEGRIIFNDKDIFTNEEEYRSQLGYMPQQQSLIPNLSIESFLFYMASLKGMSKGEAKERIESLLKDVNLYEIKKKAISQLSGGMKQRVLIAQALLNNPKLLLLDEPTVGLDPVERRNFRELIADIAKDRIVILATHVISDVEFIANKIILLEKGSILANKTQAELIAHTSVFESYETIEILKKDDSSFKLVNVIRLDDKIRVRYISKKEASNKVSTTMDDVYLDWLG